MSDYQIGCKAEMGKNLSVVPSTIDDPVIMPEIEALLRDKGVIKP